MEPIDKIIKSTIDIDLSSGSAENFGTFMLIKEFGVFDATKPFEGSTSRHREYYSLDEVIADGWSIDSDVYGAMKSAFAQDPQPESVVLGRKDSSDASWPATILAINNEFSSWYGLACVFDVSTLTASEYKQELKDVCDYIETTKKLHFIATADEGSIGFQRVLSSAYFMSGNVADISLWNEISDGSFFVAVDGATKVEVNAMDFSADTTINEVVDAINVAIAAVTPTPPEIVASVESGKIKITSDLDGKESSVVISDGTTGTSILSLLDIPNSSTILGYDVGLTPNGTLGVDGNADLATFLSSYGYDRSKLIYNEQEQDSQHLTSGEWEWLAVGQVVEAFAFDPASQTWAFKDIENCTTIEPSIGIMNFIQDSSIPRYSNIYTEIKNINMTYKGRMLSGIPVDVIRGKDWLNDLIQTRLFSQLTTTADGFRKIPANNKGNTLVQNTLNGVFGEASVHFIDADTLVLVIPKIDLTDAQQSIDRADRKLTGITWSAKLQGAYEEFEISGNVYA